MDNITGIQFSDGKVELPGDATCEACDGNGWVLSNDAEGYKDLQKCDLCEVFEFDDDAQQWALGYVKHLLDYLTNNGKHGHWASNQDREVRNA